MATGQIELNRQLTTWFINQDPTTVTLTPVAEVQTSGGGYTFEDLPERVPQIFKFIQQGSNFTGVIESGDGRERQYEFIMVGNWDAAIAIGDHWQDANGQDWRIGGFIPNNGYEIKAGVYSWGKRPGNG